MSQCVYLYSHSCAIRASSSPLGRDRTYDRLLKRELLYQLSYERLYINLYVPRRGLEPPRITPLVPKTNAATNYATWAYLSFKDREILAYFFIFVSFLIN